MGEWQPIETAPRDGSRFVGLIPKSYMRANYKPDICYWETGLTVPQFVFNGWSRGLQPAYWMKLPA